MTTRFTRQELIDILRDDSQNDWLFSLADKVRKENVGDEVHLRALIEFSSTCKRTCKYCGLRAPNKDAKRYNLSSDEIFELAQNAVNLGYKTIVLQSGENDYYTTDKMCEIIERIKNLDVALTLSIGERSFDDYKAFKNSGADRYLIRIETTDENLYRQMHPNMSFENRVKCLENLKELNYELGTGCLVGLPNQTIESLADDILFFKKMNVQMLGIGPFIPHPNTPLANAQTGSFTLALKVMALSRLMLPNINIPATTAMETLNPNGRIIALQSGANVVMPNVTTSEFKTKYEIYPNKICINEHPNKCRGCTEAKIKSIGRYISTGYGNSLNKK